MPINPDLSLCKDPMLRALAYGDKTVQAAGRRFGAIGCEGCIVYTPTTMYHAKLFAQCTDVVMRVTQLGGSVRSKRWVVKLLQLLGLEEGVGALLAQYGFEQRETHTHTRTCIHIYIYIHRYMNTYIHIAKHIDMNIYIYI